MHTPKYLRPDVTIGSKLRRAIRPRGWPAFVVGRALVTAGLAASAEPSLVLMQSAPGRFEVAAIDSSVAHGVAAAAEDAWRWLGGPLELPAAFSSPLFIRVIPMAAGGPTDNAPFRVTVEIGGIVSIRLRADLATAQVVRHALVQGLLMRAAVARHGVDARLTSPLWLEHGAVGWWHTHAEPAQLDALKQETAQQEPPTLESLLMWRHGGAEPRTSSAAAIWLLAFLQGESGGAREWSTFLRRLLAGDDPLIALVESYPGRFSSAAERELWWRTGYHQVRRVRSLPALDAADSRAQLGSLVRFVFAGASEETDVVVPLRSVMARAREPLVTAELTRRARELERLAPTLHPFYRNVGLSLGELFAARRAEPRKLEPLCAAFEEDWRDAIEVEAATAAALDRLEGRGAAP